MFFLLLSLLSEAAAVSGMERNKLAGGFEAFKCAFRFLTLIQGPLAINTAADSHHEEVSRFSLIYLLSTETVSLT